MSTVTAEDEHGGEPGAPVWGELRYGGELARLLADGGCEPRARARTPHPCC